MSVSLLPSIIPEFLIQGVPASGGLLYTYAAGTTTKLATYTDSTGSTPQTNPIVLNARGEPQNTLGNSVGLWLTNSTAYKFVLSPSTDTDPPTNAIWTIDNITAGQLTGTSYTASGTNAIALTPTNNTPTPIAYANYNTYVFAAPATSTGPVTIQVGSLGYLNAYINGVQATTGQIQSGEVVIAVYNSALNSGAGGFALYLSINSQPLVYGADTGSANAYVVNPTFVLSSLTTGQVVVFLAANANTTASTVNVSGLGAKSIVTPQGAALYSGQIASNQACVCVYNGTSWQLVNPYNTTVQNLYAADTGAANAYVVSPVPALASLAAGSLIYFKASNASTGSSTINVSGLGVKNLTRSDISSLQINDIVANGEYQAVYDGTQWQLLNPTPNVLAPKLYAAFTVSGGVLTTTFKSTNISSISRSGTGAYNISITSGVLPDANYVVTHVQEGSNTVFVGVTNKTSTGFSFACTQPGPSAADVIGLEFVVTR